MNHSVVIYVNYLNSIDFQILQKQPKYPVLGWCNVMVELGDLQKGHTTFIFYTQIIKRRNITYSKIPCMYSNFNLLALALYNMYDCINSSQISITAYMSADFG